MPRRSRAMTRSGFSRSTGGCAGVVAGWQATVVPLGPQQKVGVLYGERRRLEPTAGAQKSDRCHAVDLQFLERACRELAAVADCRRECLSNPFSNATKGRTKSSGKWHQILRENGFLGVLRQTASLLNDSEMQEASDELASCIYRLKVCLPKQKLAGTAVIAPPASQFGKRAVGFADNCPHLLGHAYAGTCPNSPTMTCRVSPPESAGWSLLLLEPTCLSRTDVPVH